MNERIPVSSQLFDRARQLCREMRELTGYDPAEESRRRWVATGRAMVAFRLLMEGWTEHAVGNALGVDHSTINHYRKKVPGWLETHGYEQEQEIWTKFINNSNGGE